MATEKIKPSAFFCLLVKNKNMWGVMRDFEDIAAFKNKSDAVFFINAWNRRAKKESGFE